MHSLKNTRILFWGNTILGFLFVGLLGFINFIQKNMFEYIHMSYICQVTKDRWVLPFNITINDQSPISN